VKIDGSDKNFSMMHYGYQLENGVFWRGLPEGWEPASLRIWIQACQKSKVILDVGANTGLFGLVGKALGSESEVFAFEPVQRVFEKLKRNCDINKFTLHCFDLALSNKDGVATIFDLATEHTYSVTVNKNLNAKETEVFETEIKIARLDTLWRNSFKDRKIDLIKLDVESHESEVLEGMGTLLGDYKPAILIEIISEEVARNVEKILGPLGYLYYQLDEVRGPERTSRLVVNEHGNSFVCTEATAQELGLS